MRKCMLNSSYAYAMMALARNEVAFMVNAKRSGSGVP